MNMMLALVLVTMAMAEVSGKEPESEISNRITSVVRSFHDVLGVLEKEVKDLQNEEHMEKKSMEVAETREFKRGGENCNRDNWDLDCDGDYICDKGRCIRPRSCYSHRDCEDLGATCDGSVCRDASCEYLEDCKPGFWCINGACREYGLSCEYNRDCHDGDKCYGFNGDGGECNWDKCEGKCKGKPCNKYEDCGYMEDCSGGRCMGIMNI